jgi:hypothetical protein
MRMVSREALPQQFSAGFPASSRWNGTLSVTTRGAVLRGRGEMSGSSRSVEGQEVQA